LTILEWVKPIRFLGKYYSRDNKHGERSVKDAVTDATKLSPSKIWQVFTNHGARPERIDRAVRCNSRVDNDRISGDIEVCLDICDSRVLYMVFNSSFNCA